MQREPLQTPPDEIAEIFPGELTKSQKLGRYWRSLWFVELWTEYRGLFKSFVADLLGSGFLGGGLELFHLWATKSSAIETQALVKVHFYGTVVVLAIFGVSFAFDIITFHWRRWRADWRRDNE